MMKKKVFEKWMKHIALLLLLLAGGVASGFLGLGTETVEAAATLSTGTYTSIGQLGDPPYTVPAGVTVTVKGCICNGSGTVATLDNDEGLFTVKSGGTLNLEDCNFYNFRTRIVYCEGTLDVNGTGSGAMGLGGNTVASPLITKGGGIYAGNGAKITLRGDANVSNNGNQDGYTNIEYGGNIYLSAGATLTIQDKVKVSSGTVTKDGGNIYAGEGAVVQISADEDNGSALYSGYAHEGNGGNIYLDKNASLTMGEYSELAYSTARKGANVFMNTGATLRMQPNSKIGGGSAIQDGGGIYTTNNNKIYCDNASISDNSVKEGNGGGLYLNGLSAFQFTGMTMHDNRALFDDLYSSNKGGGIYFGQNTDTLTMTGVTMYENSSWNDLGRGGAVYVSGGTKNLTLNNCTISDCATDNAGGGIYAEKGSGLTIAGSTISACASCGDGGGIYTEEGSSLTVPGSTISNCEVNGDGGAVYNAGTVVFSGNSRIEGSMASNGALYNAGTASITNTTIKNNIADSKGGGIFNSGTLHLQDAAVVSDNACSGELGGGLYATAAGQVTLQGIISLKKNYSNIKDLDTDNSAASTFSSGTAATNANNAYLEYASDTSFAKLAVTGTLNGTSSIGITSQSPVSGRIVVVPDGKNVTVLPDAALSCFSHDAKENGTSKLPVSADGTAANNFILSELASVQFTIDSGADHEIIPLLYGGVTKKQLDFALTIGGTVVPATDSRRNNVSFTTELIGGFKNRTAAQVATIANGGMATAGYSGIVKVTAHYGNASSKNHIYLVVPGDLSKSGDIELEDAVQLTTILRDESAADDFDVMDGSVKIGGLYLANMNNLPGVDVDDIVKVVSMVRGISDYYNGPMNK